MRSTLCPATRLYRECIQGEFGRGVSCSGEVKDFPPQRITEKGRGGCGEYSGYMRLGIALGGGGYCGLVMACVLAFGRVGWAQASEPAQNQSGQSQAGEAPPQSTQAPEQKLPDAPGEAKPDEPKPGESKKESANPVLQVGDKTKQAVGLTKGAAVSGVMKARDWESGVIAGVYVGKNRKLVTLTAEQRKEIYFRQTLTTPGAYGKRMFGALIDQARGVPAWQGGIGGYGERWASRQGQFITANTIAALGNAKLGYEVRYDKCKCEGFGPRAKHAILRNFLTYNRTETELRPQWALYGGAFAGGLVATTWKPSSQSYLVNAGWGMVGQAAYGALLNFVTEFGTEINRKQGVK